MRPHDDDYSYLTVMAGERRGTHFLLDASRPNRLGRDSDCEVRLTDRGCSRVHAILNFEDETWYLEDQGSSNGTLHNERRVTRAELAHGDRIRIAGTDFQFCQTTEPPTQTAAQVPIHGPTVVKEASIDANDSSRILINALENAEFAHDLLVIYQLSVKLLELSDPDSVIQVSLDLLHERTKAAVIGFLWTTDDGSLRPKWVLPEGSHDISLNSELSNVVQEQGRAIWLSNSHRDDESHRSRKYSDAMCIPLVKNRVTLGVIHLYLRQNRFRQADFDFAISVANLMAVSLVRTRRDAALVADHARLVAQTADFRELIGNCSAMRDLRAKIGKIAATRGSVLIRGESGSGKELVARAVHAASPRSDRPLLSINCAALPHDLLESQLFGHRRGAFTGADEDQLGIFQRADTGTLFLDEIGELPLDAQAKLLRILEGHPFAPVGAAADVTVDVRVLAATNRDLKEAVRQRRFRQDLYFRLSVFEIEIPPLRDRGDDLELLIDYFLDHYRHLHGRPQLRLSRGARDRLLSYDWPGNVRQLRNVIDSAVVMAESDTIENANLGIHAVPVGERPATLKIADWEKMLIQDALTRTRGKIPEAAVLLGIGRATLYRKIDEYNIPR